VITGLAVGSPGTEIPYSTSVPMIRRAVMTPLPREYVRRRSQAVLQRAHTVEPNRRARA
jgi:hypothetical protein